MPAAPRTSVPGSSTKAINRCSRGSPLVCRTAGSRRRLGWTLGFLATAGALAAQSPQAPPVFRSATSLVPIDVRVVDRAGDPVTNLKASDFTVLENGVRQEIRHFSTQSLAAQTAGVAPAVHPATDPAPLGSQTRRIFLI